MNNYSWRTETKIKTKKRDTNFMYSNKKQCSKNDMTNGNIANLS